MFFEKVLMEAERGPKQVGISDPRYQLAATSNLPVILDGTLDMAVQQLAFMRFVALSMVARDIAEGVTPTQMSESFTEWGARFEKMLESHGLPTANLMPAFEAMDQKFSGYEILPRDEESFFLRLGTGETFYVKRGNISGRDINQTRDGIQIRIHQMAGPSERVDLGRGELVEIMALNVPDEIWGQLKQAIVVPAVPPTLPPVVRVPLPGLITAASLGMEYDLLDLTKKNKFTSRDLQRHNSALLKILLTSKTREK